MLEYFHLENTFSAAREQWQQPDLFVVIKLNVCFFKKLSYIRLLAENSDYTNKATKSLHNTVYHHTYTNIKSENPVITTPKKNFQNKDNFVDSLEKCDTKWFIKNWIAKPA